MATAALPSSAAHEASADDKVFAVHSAGRGQPHQPDDARAGGGAAKGRRQHAHGTQARHEYDRQQPGQMHSLVIPSTEGVASGFRVTVCMSRPAADSAPPTSSARTTRGSRNSLIVRVVSASGCVPSKAWNTSAGVKDVSPRHRAVANMASSRSVHKARNGPTASAWRHQQIAAKFSHGRLQAGSHPRRRQDRPESGFGRSVRRQASDCTPGFPARGLHVPPWIVAGVGFLASV